MSEAEFLSSLIGDIYDAALDPMLWPGVLEQSSRFVGGCAAGLYSKDSVSKSAEINPNYGFGVDARDQQRYMRDYARIDPMTTGCFFFDVGEIMSTTDVLPFEEFVETRFYKEWVRSLGWIDTATAMLEKSGASYSVFSVFRHERDGLVDEACRRRMRILVPHVRRAVLIGKTIQLKRTEADTFADVLDELAAGVFLVDRAAYLAHANASGKAMLAEESILRVAGGRLVASDPVADNTLRRAFSSAEDGDCGVGTQAIAVPLGTDEKRYVAHVLPLTSGGRRHTGRGHAAAVFVRKVELNAPPHPEVIARHYRLTPSELRVLLAVFESGGVPNIKDLLGISEATARTHLRRLFEKTGTKRQADLVKLVASFTRPE